jgi:hypothetical protein
MRRWQLLQPRSELGSGKLLHCNALLLRKRTKMQSIISMPINGVQLAHGQH